MARTTDSGVPLYQQIKLHILDLIHREQWDENRRLPSESELVEKLLVSRMTVNRAFRELANEGYIKRIAGLGTFANEPRAESHPLEILNIAEEIRARGHVHSCRVVSLSEKRADSLTAMQFSIVQGSRLLHSLILHFESGIPIQVEDRYILPNFAPGYLDTDFTQTTTYEYLMKMRSDIEQVEQILSAEIPDERIANLLDTSDHEPVLVLARRTWIDDAVVTSSHLHHPATRFQFSSRYKP